MSNQGQLGGDGEFTGSSGGYWEEGEADLKGQVLHYYQSLQGEMTAAFHPLPADHCRF